MKIVRYMKAGHAYFGQLRNGEIIECDGDPFTGLAPKASSIASGSVELLTPVVPTKIICAGLNYQDHATEHSVAVPDVPLVFLKPPSALLPSGHDIVLPFPKNRNEEEAELAVVIGRRARFVAEHDVASYILGFVAGNDVSDRDVQEEDRSWTGRSKCFDTFAPVGSAIHTDIVPDDLGIAARVNGQVVQSSRTSKMIFDVRQLVSFLSHCYTLEPGDLVFTGTPSGVTEIHPGDVVEIVIEGMDILQNSVSAQVSR